MKHERCASLPYKVVANGKFAARENFEHKTVLRKVRRLRSGGVKRDLHYVSENMWRKNKFSSVNGEKSI